MYLLWILILGGKLLLFQGKKYVFVFEPHYGVSLKRSSETSRRKLLGKSLLITKIFGFKRSFRCKQMIFERSTM